MAAEGNAEVYTVGTVTKADRMRNIGCNWKASWDKGMINMLDFNEVDDGKPHMH